jgi:predicted nucleic-acid-binding Zn-ribbon protein|tara:strand:+ start:61 stop:300 length:240 start_codon:yes stop_codon:yes gene_type:complete
MNREQPGLNIDFSQTTAEICGKCGNDTFVQVFKIRKLSALLSPAGKETMIPMQVFACAKCGNINSAFLPKELDEVDDTV